MNQREMPIIQPIPIRIKYKKYRWLRFFQRQEYKLRYRFSLDLTFGNYWVKEGTVFKMPLLHSLLIPYLIYYHDSYVKKASPSIKTLLFYKLANFVNGKHWINWVIWKGLCLVNLFKRK